MTITIASGQLRFSEADRLPFQWMLECLFQDKPSFRFFKAQFNNETVYVFTRHHYHLGKRSPSLCLMGKNWQKPIVLATETAWHQCYSQLQTAELRTSQPALKQSSSASLKPLLG